MDRHRPNRPPRTRRNYSCRLAFRVAAHRGQTENETRAAIGSVLRTDLTPVRFNDRANNGQSHAHSGLLGGKEMIEDLLRPILGQADAEIAHADFRALST